MITTFVVWKRDGDSEQKGRTKVGHLDSNLACEGVRGRVQVGWELSRMEEEDGEKKGKPIKRGII